jgi:hypothetical protein
VLKYPASAADEYAAVRAARALAYGTQARVSNRTAARHLRGEKKRRRKGRAVGIRADKAAREEATRLERERKEFFRTRAPTGAELDELKQQWKGKRR